MGPLVMEVLGFVYYIIFITVNDEETFDLGALGRGPRRANRHPTLFYAIYLDLIYQIAILRYFI